VKILLFDVVEMLLFDAVLCEDIVWMPSYVEGGSEGRTWGAIPELPYCWMIFVVFSLLLISY